MMRKYSAMYSAIGKLVKNGHSIIIVKISSKVFDINIKGFK